MARDIKILDGTRYIMVEQTNAVRLMAAGFVIPKPDDKVLTIAEPHTLEDVKSFLKSNADKCDSKILDVAVAIVVTTECSGHGRQKHVIEVPTEIVNRMATELDGPHKEDVEKIDWLKYINPNLN